MNERDIFIAACHIASPEDRRRYLEEACGGDLELRRQVEELLQAQQDAGSFLQSPAAAAYSPTISERPVSEAPGMVIGPYKLLEQIGEGGFGVVFMAEQTAPVKRKVALKVIKPGMDTREVIARFEAERQALALMDHPNIAKVFDAGTTGEGQGSRVKSQEALDAQPLTLGPSCGRPYFVMELVRGVPITDYCDQHQLTPKERLELFVTVCQAVQHAHQKGIIHRDIKPSNVLVTLHDDKPMVKVIDFGIAKATSGQLTDKTLFTGFAQLVGTPLYMSPEQASMSGVDVDTRSDIYSLGVLLYELLTGTTPFDKARLQQAAFDEVRRIIREEEPQKPSTRLSSSASLPSVAANRHLEPAKLTRLVRGDLDWIVMKALEKDRARRYETANGFASDVLHYLADEPVTACPPSTAYRFRKFARRNKAALATGALVSAMLVAAVVVLAVSNVLITRERNEKAAALELARLNEQAAREQLQRTEKAQSVTNNALDRLPPWYYARYEDLTIHPFLTPQEWKTYHVKMELYENLIQCNPEPRFAGIGTAEAYEMLGGSHLELGEFEAAEKNLRSAVSLFERLIPEHDAPDYRTSLADTYLYLGDVLEKTGRLGEAEEAYREAIRLSAELQRDPSQPWHLWVSLGIPPEPYYRTQLTLGYTALGCLLHRTGRLVEAEAAYRQALVWADGQHPVYAQWSTSGIKALSRLGDLHMHAGRDPEAEEAFRSVCRRWNARLAESPNNREFLWNSAAAEDRLGCFLSQAGRAEVASEAYLRALPIWEKLIAAYPPVPAYPRQLAWFLATCPDVEFRDSARALTLAQKSIKLAPNDAQNWTTLAAAHYRAGHWSDALAALDKSTELRRSEDGFDGFLRAMVRLQMGYRQEACTLLDQSLEWMTNNAQNSHELRRLAREAEELIRPPALATQPEQQTEEE